MLQPEQTSVHPQVGQFWVHLNPLTLLRIEAIGELANGGNPFCFTAYTWTPDGEGPPGSYIGFNPEHFRHLWFHDIHPREFIRSYYDLDLNKAQVGDVWLIRTPQEPRPGLVFIGPETSTSQIHIVADWVVRLGLTDPAQFAQLYQPGPGRRNPTPKSSYDHLRNPSV